MSTTSVNPSSGFPKDQLTRVQSQILDSNFEKITLVKSFVPPTAVETVEEALATLNGDAAHLMKIVNSGLVNVARANAKAKDGGWYNKDTEKVYDGIRLDQEKAGDLLLGLAKNSFGKIYTVDPTKAKEEAKKFLQGPGKVLLADLIIGAAAETEGETEAEGETETTEAE